MEIFYKRGIYYILMLSFALTYEDELTLMVGKNLYSKICHATIHQALKQTGLPFVKIKDLKPEMTSRCHFSVP